MDCIPGDVTAKLRVEPSCWIAVELALNRYRDADQNEMDHAALKRAIHDGKVVAAFDEVEYPWVGQSSPLS